MWLPGLSEISWFFDWVRETGVRRTEKIDKAVEALGSALMETRIYIRDRSDKAQRSTERENELAKLWMDASHSLRRIRNDTAKIARMKSEYWLDPERWQGDASEEDAIAIENVIKKYDDLWKTKLL
jgi:hypothetical protein